MRIPLYVRALLAVVFLFAFWLGRDTAEQGLVLPKPLLKHLAKSNAPPALLPGAKPLQSQSPLSLKTVLNSTSSGALFRALFDERFLTNSGLAPAEIMSEVRQRFRKPYPREERAYERELIHRVGILKALHAALPPGAKSATPDTASFYRELLQREPWLVKRQAMRNLVPWFGTKPEAEREQIRKEAGGRVLASIALSDDEILEQVFHEPH